MSNAVAVKAHAELGASVASRWMACPGSVRLSRGIPNTENEHSRAGTTAHAVGEMALRRKADPAMWEGLEVEGVPVTEEMTEAVSVYVNYCRARIEASDYHGIEERFSLEDLNPPGSMFGTTDFWAFTAGHHELEVVDYKNGSGVVVEVKNNKQLRYYALGAALALGKKHAINRVKITVIQPRAYHPDGVIRSEVVDYLDLLGFAGELMEAARETLRPDAPLATGSHCRFCPASPICPAQRSHAQALAQVEFAAMPLDTPPSPETLPVAMLGDMLGKLPILEAWIDSMKAHAFNLMERGEEVPGMKLVAKRSTRKWANTGEVERWCIEKGLAPEEMYKQDLKSPAQIEKVVGKKHLPADLVTNVSSGYSMVPTSDKRPAVMLTPGSEFAALPPASE